MPKPRFTHRPPSSSLLWFIFRILYKVIPKRNYLGPMGGLMLVNELEELTPLEDALLSQVHKKEQESRATE